MILSPAEWEIVALSLQVAGVAVVASLPFGMALAYALARRRVPLSFLVENLIQLLLVLPPVVTGVLLLIAGRKGRWGDGWRGRWGFRWPSAGSEPRWRQRSSRFR